VTPLPAYRLVLTHGVDSGEMNARAASRRRLKTTAPSCLAWNHTGAKPSTVATPHQAALHCTWGSTLSQSHTSPRGIFFSTVQKHECRKAGAAARHQLSRDRPWVSATRQNKLNRRAPVPTIVGVEAFHETLQTLPFPLPRSHAIVIIPQPPIVANGAACSSVWALQ
jgi:hypothetical protein